MSIGNISIIVGIIFIIIELVFHPSIKYDKSGYIGSFLIVLNIVLIIMGIVLNFDKKSDNIMEESLKNEYIDFLREKGYSIYNPYPYLNKDFYYLTKEHREETFDVDFYKDEIHISLKGANSSKPLIAKNKEELIACIEVWYMNRD